MQAIMELRRWTIGWLEGLLLLAFIGLILQVVPFSVSILVAVISPVTWAPWGWLSLNFAVLFILLGLRSNRPKALRVSKFAARAACYWTLVVVARYILPFVLSGLMLGLLRLAVLLDFRTWGQSGWLAFTIVLLLVLCAVRFAPEISKNANSAWAALKQKHRVRAKPSHITESGLSEKEERALYERMAEARKKQVVRG
jgi:hypothetical protein